MLPQHNQPFYITGGTLPRDAVSYVCRDADETLFQGLLQRQLCYVLTTRQMGKSSLMVRTADRLTRYGSHVVVLDLSGLGQNLTVAQWYEGMLNHIGTQLDLEDTLEDFWHNNASLPPLERWLRALKEVMLPRIEGPIVLFIDEIDMVRSLPFPTDEFFTGIRACYNRRDLDPAFKRLTFCLLGVAAPSDLIHNVDITPFNIGKRIELNDFTTEEAKTLSTGISATGRDGTGLLARILHWTGGHPYLTQRLCAAVVEDTTAFGEAAVDRLCGELFLSHRAQAVDDNLAIVRNRLLRSGEDLTALLGMYARVLNGKRVSDEEANPLCSVLKLSGVVRSQDGILRVRNRIYARVFDRAWVTTNLPGAEVRRQRLAYQQGAFRALGAAAVVVVALSGLSFYAFKERNLAQANAVRERQARSEADRNASERAKALIEANHQRSLAEAKTSEANRALVEAKRQRQLAESSATKTKQALAEARLQKRIANENLVLAQERLARLKSANDATAQALTDSRLQRDNAEHTAYTASLNLIQREYENNNVRHTLELLKETESSPYRGFEWGYWNRLCHLELFTLNEPEFSASSWITGVAFSPDGHSIVSVRTDGTIKFWDAQTGKETYAIATHQPDPHIAFSPDGSRIVIGGSDGMAKIWDSHTRKPIRTLKQGVFISSVAYSPDGKRILTGSRDYTARVWDAETGQSRLILKGHTNGVESVAFSPDGNRIVTGSSDGTAKVWDAWTGHNTLTLANGTFISCAVFSPDSKRVATSSWDHTVKVWDAQTGQTTLVLKGHTDNVNGVAFSPDGKQIAAESADCTVRVWNAQSGQETLLLKGHTSLITSFAFSPDGKRILSGCLDCAKVWDARLGHETLTLPAQPGGIPGAGFSSDGKHVVIGRGDGTLKSWNTQTGNETLILRAQPAIHSMALSSDGKRVVAVSRDIAKIWDTESGKEIHTLIGHTAKITSVAFSPDGRRIVTGSEDKTAKLWDAQTGTELYTLRGHSEQVASVAFSPNGDRILTGSFDNTAKIWDTETGKAIRTLRGHTAFITCAVFSSDGKQIATASWDKTVGVWEAQTGKETLILKGHTQFVNCVAFSPDGKRIVSGSFDTTAKVWDAQTGKETVTLKGQAAAIMSVAFSPDSRRILTIGRDSIARIWFADSAAATQIQY